MFAKVSLEEHLKLQDDVDLSSTFLGMVKRGIESERGPNVDKNGVLAHAEEFMF